MYAPLEKSYTEDLNDLVEQELSKGRGKDLKPRKKQGMSTPALDDPMGYHRGEAKMHRKMGNDKQAAKHEKEVVKLISANRKK